MSPLTVRQTNSKDSCHKVRTHKSWTKKLVRAELWFDEILYLHRETLTCIEIWNSTGPSPDTQLPRSLFFAVHLVLERYSTLLKPPKLSTALIMDSGGVGLVLWYSWIWHGKERCRIPRHGYFVCVLKLLMQKQKVVDLLHNSFETSFAGFRSVLFSTQQKYIVFCNCVCVVT